MTNFLMLHTPNSRSIIVEYSNSRLTSFMGLSCCMLGTFKMSAQMDYHSTTSSE